VSQSLSPSLLVFERNRALAEQVIQGNGGRRISHRFGVELCLANLPGDGFRARHDALVDTILVY